MWSFLHKQNRSDRSIPRNTHPLESMVEDIQWKHANPVYKSKNCYLLEKPSQISSS